MEYKFKTEELYCEKCGCLWHDTNLVSYKELHELKMEYSEDNVDVDIVVVTCPNCSDVFWNITITDYNEYLIKSGYIDEGEQ